jgi:hypothetical protein
MPDPTLFTITLHWKRRTLRPHQSRPFRTAQVGPRSYHSTLNSWTNRTCSAQKFGGTSVGKFPIKIAHGPVYVSVRSHRSLGRKQREINASDVKDELESPQLSAVFGKCDQARQSNPRLEIMHVLEGAQANLLETRPGDRDSLHVVVVQIEPEMVDRQDRHISELEERSQNG